MDDAARDWSRLHHDIDPAGVVLLRPWLVVVRRIALPLRRVPPLLLTALGAALAVLAAVWFAPWPAFGLVLAATLCDALDGAVAVLADRATGFGAVADKVADRVADSAFALVLWRCGAPLWLAVVAGSLSLLHEAVREVAGGWRRARITVAERPSRVICTLLACLSAALASATWPASVCAAVWIALAVVGLGQLCGPSSTGRSRG